MRDTERTNPSVFETFSEPGTDSAESYDVTIGTRESDTPDVEAELEDLLDEVTQALPTEEVTIDEAIVKENLEEILLLLISLHGETHGKQLLSDLGAHFGAQLSPGTVYPCLHGMEEDGVLSMHTMVRTKEYSIADEDVVRSRVERTMLQHLSFGLLLYAFLPRL